MAIYGAKRHVVGQLKVEAGIRPSGYIAVDVPGTNVHAPFVATYKRTEQDIDVAVKDRI